MQEIHRFLFFVNCATSPEDVDCLLDPAVGLLNVIAMVITTDANENNISQAYKILANITLSSWIPNRIDEFQRLDLHVLALNVLKPLGPNPNTWKDRSGTFFYCQTFLMYISAYPEAVISLKSAGALDIFTPILATSSREAIIAALIVIFLAGKEESSSQKVALLQAHPHLTDMLVDLLEAQLSGGEGAAYDRMCRLGYGFHWYPINLVVRGILALSISDANKSVLVATRILSPLVQLLQRFRDNAPQVRREYKMGNSTAADLVGGGSDDIAAGTAAIETIVQLTFFFDSDTELVQQFITPKSGVEKLFNDLLELSANRQYCKVWKKSHGLQLLYVMMDNEYTTVSKTKTVDGWLGFMLGTELWYPLWSPGNVQSTAIELGKLIGDNARSDGSSSAPSSPSKTMVASASSPTVVSSPPPTSAPPAVDYAQAWAVITDSRRALAGKFDELTAYVQEQGFVESSDLETFCNDEEVMATIRGFLNPVGQKLFIKAMGI